MKNRCNWVNLDDNLYIKYHDEEWGTPCYDDNILFEYLVLESFQAGLSWSIILRKRENFRKAFDNFDIDRIIEYDEEKINELMNDKSIIRNKNKINATINNAKVFKEIQKEFGSFSNYIWSFTNEKILKNTEHNYSKKNYLSDKISKDLKKRGMKFLGSITVYAYLQSIGIINDHEKTCFRYNEN